MIPNLTLKRPWTRIFLLKKGLVTEHAILWEAHKATIRGHCIALDVKRKRHAQLKVS